MNQLLNDPYTVLALFFVCAALAIGSLLSAMKSGGSKNGLLLALLFAGLAAYFAPSAFALISGSSTQ
ncbi:hypothetical protein [Altererythrobacter sp. MF3-039]|uniref:hypothetical protein n=1 Tax=Altererythrobacter sp. MF3-039 TaxID=3252901 RepID=UPI00390C843D